MRGSHERRIGLDYLVEHLSLEGEEIPPPRPDEQAHQLVVDPVVDLQHTENEKYFRKKSFKLLYRLFLSGYFEGASTLLTPQNIP
jgi:hypothetical protein